MSKHTLVGGDARKLLDLLARLKSRAEQRIAAPVEVVAIQEAGLDGFWIHRLLEANGVESHVVDPASIAVPRRHRRAKTDAIDGETLLRTLMAWQRGEPRVCAMTVPPTPSEEDRRRVSRERATLLRERIRHTNRNSQPANTELGFLAPASRRNPGHGGCLSMQLTRRLAAVTPRVAGSPPHWCCRRRAEIALRQLCLCFVKTADSRQQLGNA
jgi:transposase